MPEVPAGKIWKGTNRELDAADLSPEQSPDQSNCCIYRGNGGQLGARYGRTFWNTGALLGTVVGVIPWAYGGKFKWLVAQDDGVGTGFGDGVTIQEFSAPFQGGAVVTGGAPTAAPCGSAAVALNAQWDLIGTSGTLVLGISTPYGTFTMTEADADSAATKTQTLGCLTFNYPGASRGNRGVLTIKGVMGLGEYDHVVVLGAGSIASTSTGTVLKSGHYTCTPEGANNLAINFGDTIHPLTITNHPCTLAA